MDEPNWQNKLDELVREFENQGKSQQGKLAALAKQAHNNHRKLQKSVKNLQESLDYLRMCIKYQFFDLEATRRENGHLKKMLERNQGNG